MDTLAQKIDALSPEKRAILFKRLRVGATVGSPRVDGQRTPRSEAPLSFAQERLWFLDRLYPESTAYLCPAALRLSGSLRRDALKTSLAEVVKRHEVLRTRFAERDGELIQQIVPAAPVPLPLVDLAALSPGDRQHAAKHLAKAEARRRFDLARGTPLRTTLLSLGRTDHVLLLTLHHIVCDGWSVGVLIRELTALYSASTTGVAANLPELPAQFADFAVSQRARMKGALLDRHLEYWRAQLDGISAVSIPTDRPRPVVFSDRCAAVQFALPRETAQRLHRVCRETGTTPFIVLLATFQLLLARYSGQNDIAVGTPVALRNQIESEGLIGCFLNTLVLRTRWSGHETFKALLGRLRETVFDAYAHQELPFEKLVEELAPARDLNRSTLVQVMLSLDHHPPALPEWPAVAIEPFTGTEPSAKFDLTLAWTEEENGDLHARLEYAADLFDAATIQRLAEQFTVLAARLLADPCRPVSEVDPLPTPERAHLVDRINATACDWPPDTVPAWFARQAAETPAAIAVEGGGAHLSYGELHRRATQLAGYLSSLNHIPETTIALGMGRGLDMVVAALGIMQSGGTYLPIDVYHPAERLAYTLADANARVLVTDSHERGRLELLVPDACAVLAIDGDWDKISAAHGVPLPPVLPGQLAYVIYTSGSTGRPKGVAVTHGALANLIHAFERLLNIGAADRLIALTTLSFDIAGLELYAPLVTGGRIVVAGYETAKSPVQLAECIQTQQATIVQATPATWEQLRAAAWQPPADLQVLCGGEALGHALAAALVSTGARIWNVYGPTETTIWSMSAQLNSANLATSVPVGRPLANTHVYVLDAEGELTPTGVPGELFIGGTGVARGYVGQPSLTAERFVPDPFSVCGARLYRTGDRVRWRNDQQLEFLGRFDHQVKLRGYRIELGEIEAALEAHPQVRRCAVVLRGDAPEKAFLAAYVVAHGEPPTEEAFRRFLRRRLPEYMLPGAYVLLDRLPLTPNGKLDRRALPAPEYRASEPVHEELPRTPVEEIVAVIWCEVLHHERVGRTADFFALGGHSLLATQVVARVRAAFGVEVPVRSLFESPTVAGLAAAVEVERRAGSGGVAPPIQPIRHDQPIPLSFAQQRLWFLQQLEPNSTAYHMPSVVRLEGPLQVNALRASLTEVVRRHAVLRTSFPLREGTPVQQIHPPGSVAMPVVDVAAVKSETQRMALARRLARVEAARRFDLARGPLLRAALLRLGADDHVLLLTAHHVVSDGWSLGLLLWELTTLYGAACRGEASPLEALPIQYADVTAWQRAWLESGVLDRQREYWRKQLAGTPVLDLPADRPRAAVSSDAGEELDVTIAPELAAQLQQWSRQRGATLFMTLLTAFQALLGRYAGQRDVAVGTPVANRTQVETEGLIGCFVNTLVLRTGWSEETSVAELLAQVRETVLEAHANQDLPFEQLVEELAPVRDLSRTPLFQAMLVLQNAPRAAEPLAELTLTPFATGTRTSKYDLTMHAWEDAGALHTRFEYATTLFDRNTIERFCGHLQQVLSSMIQDPGRRVAELDILTPAEHHEILFSWNGTFRDYSRGLLHELLAARMAEHSTAVALVARGHRHTYAELDAQSNRLAHRLRALGVGPEVRVAICLDRTVDLIVSLIAVLKAGGVYIPLDPEYPRDRLAYIMADSRAAVLITANALRARAGSHAASVVCVDEDADDISKSPRSAPATAMHPENLACILYTSGSTGRPKGVQLTHGSLVAFVHWAAEAFDRSSFRAVLAGTSVCFDLFAFELYATLNAGGCVFLANSAMDLPLFADAGLTLVNSVPSAVAAVLESGGLPPSVGLVNLAGEPLSGILVEHLYATGNVRQVVNLYGPTETTTYSTFSVIPRGTPKPSIGRPIANTQVYVLDGEGQLVPAGVPGGLYIAGAGLARGYINQPALTAQKFVPNPFASTPGARMYQTGDRCRWLASGELEFLGRSDHQVKLRGFRIELGEVEAALRAQPGVRESAVVARDDQPGGKTLVAYVVPNSVAREDEGAASEQVADWNRLWSETYSRNSSSGDPALDLTAWNSSYTGEPIPEAAMREWIDHTADRISAHRPSKVLDIGCGTGLVLFRIASQCQQYLATDFSAEVLHQIEQNIAADPSRWASVVLKHQGADDFNEIPEQQFDLAVLNSVVQYFPDVNYLLRVIEGAVRTVKPGGNVFLGDIRALPLLELFHTSVQSSRAPASRATADLRRDVAESARREEELLVAPAFFTALRERIPQISHVEICPKRGRDANEMVKFRYDVVLHISDDAAALAGVEWEDYQEHTPTLGMIRERLGRDCPESWGLAGVPNRRLAHDLSVMALMDGAAPPTALDLRAAAEAMAQAGAFDPEDLWALEEELPYWVEISWARGQRDGSFDVAFVRRSPSCARPWVGFPHVANGPAVWTGFVNQPSAGTRRHQLVGQLRSALAKRLPEYMLPGAYVLLDRLPLTPNGKLDRRALPAPEYRASEPVQEELPRTPVEEIVAGIWCEVLHQERVGRTADFFALGGHSLLATQVVARVRAAFGVEVPVRTLFESPTVAGLAAAVEVQRRAGSGGVAPPIQPMRQDQPIPLSFAQQRLWFLQQLEPDSTAYHMPSAVRMEGPLQVNALRASLTEVVRRHAVLRTSFPLREGTPVQQIHPAGAVAMPVVDVAAVRSETQRLGLARRLGRVEAARRFDLARGPLLRAQLLRLGADDHVLLLTAHHVVSDGWSLGLLLRELTTLYGAACRGEASPLDPLPIQYADVTAWQRTWLESGVLDRQREYWRKQLAGTPVLDLPADRPRAAVSSDAGAELDVTIAPELAGQLQQWSRQRGATLFMTLLTAFQALLGRYAGQRDVAVGTPVANRTQVETEGLIGCFVNTLVLRTGWSEETSVADLLAQVRETVLEAHAHQDLPFEHLVEELAPVRDLSRTPLFQAMLVLQNAPRAEEPLAELMLTPFATGTRTSKYDLTMYAWEDAGALHTRFEYATSLFDRSTIERMAQHFIAFAGRMVANAGARVQDLDLLLPSERTHLLVETNRTAQSTPHEMVPALVERQAILTPDAIAVEAADGQLSYRELVLRATALAHRLQVRPEAAVGIAVSRGLDMVIALLGTLQSGAAYVPLDTNYPPDRLAHTVADAGVRLILTDSHQRARLGSLLEGRTIILVDDGHGTKGATEDFPAPPLVLDQLAYIIYTSGSTGRSKGVAVSHGALTNFLHAMRGLLSLDSTDRLVAVTTLSFDIAGLEIYLPLICGARVIVARRDVAQSGAALAALMESRQATILQATPATWEQLLMAGWKGHAGLQVLCGGEALRPALAAGLLNRSGHVWNLYGPTETAIWSMAARLSAAPQWGIPLGAPIANTQVYVLDGNGEAVPTGVAGELFIGGAGVARGYVNQPGLTAERFVPDPFGRAGARLYRTGDRVRWRNSGEMEFLGRIDNQVKLRGYRIEPGEIEAALLDHPQVRQCVVIRREDMAGDARLIAYAVAEGEAPTAEQLRRRLQGRVPDYMIPAAYVMLDCLPLTPNGKLDRRALPAPIPEAAGETQHAEAADPVEEIIAGIFCELLGSPHVARTGNFFELGGHSLLATQAMARLRAAFHVDLAVRVLFEKPTVAELARAIPSVRRDASVPAAPPIDAVLRGGPMPLSFAQERFWFLQQLDPASAAYHVPVAVRLDGHLRREVLGVALAEVVRRHEVLRSTFAVHAGVAVQHIAAPGPVPLLTVDLSACPPDERERLAHKLANMAARRPFDLGRGPLIHTILLRLDAQSHVLSISLHHAVADQWSLGVLLRDLVAIYSAALTGSSATLPELRIQYADVAAWQREWLQGAQIEAHLQYWRTQLADLPVLALPTDRLRIGAGQKRAGEAPVFVPAEIAARVRQLSQEHGVTLFIILAAAFQVLLGRYAGQTDVAIGTPVSGRSQLDTEALIGCFVNTLVLRTRWNGRPSVAELLTQVRETLLDAHAHRDLPFEKLVQELSPERDVDRSPLFQAVLTLEHLRPQYPSVPGLALTPFSDGYRAARFDLTMGLVEQPGGSLTGRIEYPAELFEPATVEGLAQRFTLLLARMADNPTLCVHDLDILTAAERVHLIEGVNAANPACLAPSVPDAFAQQAIERPDAIAIEADGAQISYGELARRAIQLAYHLQSLGLAPESPVCVGLDRGPDLAVALLGILYAGGAYVPLDLSFPLERLAFLIEDAGATILVTNASARKRLATAPFRTVVSLDEDAARSWWGRRFRLPSESSSVAPAGRRLAYLMYTSGSTGQPKGVTVCHDGILRLVTSPDYVSIDARDVLLQFAPISFDASTLEIWGALVNGARLVMFPPGVASLEELGRVIERSRVTIVWLTAGLFHQMVDHHPDALAHTRQVLAGGEALSPAHVHRALEAYPDVTFINGYGPTENTTFTCCHTVERAFDGRTTVPIGRPVRGTRVYVTDAEGDLVPIGAAGELYAGGAGVARGYANRAALTAAKFVPDPFEPGGRLYRTGDRVRWRNDGTLEFLGRFDQQVKLRGFRIEPGEIEAALNTHPDVKQSAVILREDGSIRQLVAYVASAAAPSAQELLRHLRAKLPGYMIPGAFVMVDRLPLTPNGKLDVRQLPAPALDAQLERGEFEPCGPLEDLIAGIWTGVLQREPIGRDDHFFELGGHSLLAAQVITRVREKLHIELPLRTLFEAPTLAQFAAAVEIARRGADQSLAPRLRPISGDAPRPLSPAQRRLWFLAQLNPDSSVYSVPVTLRLTGKLQPHLLRASITEVVRRHEVLRTSFPTRNGEPVQQTVEASAVPLPVVDIAALSGSFQQRALEALAHEEAARPFNLGHGPLLRLKLVRLGEESHVLQLTLHHIVTDAWSMRILFRELTAIYESLTAGMAPALPDVPVQYADFARWHLEWLQGDVLAQHLRFWREQLRDLPVLDLPVDRPRPPVASYCGAELPISIPGETVRELEQRSRESGATLFMTILAAFQVVLGRYAGQQDVVIGTPTANRWPIETEGLIGLFVNTLVLRARWNPQDTFRDLLGCVRERVLSAYAHRDLPFDTLVEALSPVRDMSRSPLFQAAFNMLYPPEPARYAAGLEISEIETPATGAKVDLSLVLSHHGDSMSGSLVYNADLFHRGTIQEIGECLMHLLEAVSQDADRPLALLVSGAHPQGARAAAAGFSESLQSLEI